MDFIASIERATGKSANKNMLPMQPGDVESTSADVSDLKSAVGFVPNTPLDTGMQRFVEWYRDYHRV